jgi:hypothetical protein
MDRSRALAECRVTTVREIGRRQRTQPAPPHIVFEALTDPERPGARRWLDLLDDEQQPRLLHIEAPTKVVWSSIWINRPDAVIELDLPADGAGGTNLCWTLLVDDPTPDAALVGHMSRRINVLINANLRYSFGQ